MINELPHDVLNSIIFELDYISIFSLCKISKTLNNHYISGGINHVLRAKLKFGYIDNIRDDLQFICRVRSKKHLISANERYVFALSYSGYLHIIAFRINRIVNNKLTGIIQICHTSNYVFSLTRRGCIYISALNDIEIWHKLIYGDSDICQIAMIHRTLLALRNNGDVYILDKDINVEKSNNLLFRHIEGLNNIIQITVACNYIIVLDYYGKIYKFKSHDVGSLESKLEVISGIDNIIEISNNSVYLLALTYDGRVYFFNIYNNLYTLLPNLNGIVQIALGISYGIVLTYKGKIVKFSTYNFERLITEEYINEENICEIFYDGTVYVRRFTDNTIKINDSRSMALIG